jgi:hypothetical protein
MRLPIHDGDRACGCIDGVKLIVCRIQCESLNIEESSGRSFDGGPGMVLRQRQARGDEQSAKRDRWNDPPYSVGKDA